MNSSFAPFGPCKRNSEMINWPVVATLADGGSTIGVTLRVETLLAPTLPRALAAGAGAGAGTSVVVLTAGVVVVLASGVVAVLATGAVETAAGMVGPAYAPRTTMAGAVVLLFFFFFLGLRDEELLVASAFAAGPLV